MLNSADTLNIQNCIKPKGNCVYQMYGLSEFVEKLNIQNCVNSMGNCVHHTYGLSGFTQKLNSVDTLNVQNCVNPTRYCVHQMYRLSRFAKKVGYLELCNFNGKLCKLYVRIVWIKKKKEKRKKKKNSMDMLKVQNCIDPMRNCVHQMHRLSGFVENLNIQNCLN